MTFDTSKQRNALFKLLTIGLTLAKIQLQIMFNFIVGG